MQDNKQTMTFRRPGSQMPSGNVSKKNKKTARRKERVNLIVKTICIVLAFILVTGNTAVAITVIGADTGSTGSGDILSQLDNLTLKQTSIVYVKNSSGDWVEYQRLHASENRIWVSYDEIPKNLINAFISIEDKRFYQHHGVDWTRTAAAFANSVFHFYSSNQGGSTITQQLVKNLTGDDEQTPSRKIREIKRALSVEQNYSKNTIMECYLNTIYFGNSLYGVETASNYYFGKGVSELSLSECASLASIVKDPYTYKPDDHPDNNKKRRNVVLSEMLDQGCISQDDYDKAVSEDVTVATDHSNMNETDINNYFIDTLIDELASEISSYYGLTKDIAVLDLYNGGFKIYSTLDTSVQNALESVYTDSSYFKQLSSDKTSTPESAMTVMDYSGHIVGIVGGTGTKTVNRGLNRATSSPRQPGSTIKPLSSYSLAIDKGLINYGTSLDDSPIDNYYPDGTAGPADWYSGYYGTVSLEKALEISINTIPCKLVKQLSVNTSYNFLTEDLGMQHLVEGDKNLAALGIGGLTNGITTTESAAAFAIFGNGGNYYSPTTYEEVKDASDRTIFKSSVGKNVIGSDTATIMNHLLQNVVTGTEGTGRAASGSLGMPFYAKTGTSNDSKDLWFVGGSPYYVASCWYGFDTPEDLTNYRGALNVWKAVMSKVHSGLAYEDFTYDENVKQVKYCLDSGEIATDGCTNTAMGWFNVSKTSTCHIHGASATQTASATETTPQVTKAETTAKSVQTGTEPSTKNATTTSPDTEKGEATGTETSKDTSEPETKK